MHYLLLQASALQSFVFLKENFHNNFNNRIGKIKQC